MLHTIATLPAAHPWLSVAAAIVALFAVGWAGAGLLRPAPDPQGPERFDDEDYARFLRIVQDDRERGTAAWTYAPRPVVSPALAAVDDRTAELIVDPTLGAREVEQIVEQVAPGAGSVASVAALAEDTRLRGPQALAALERGEEAAYAEAQRREIDELFAGFDSAVAEQLARLDRVQAAAAHWSFYLHDDELAHCPHCTEAVGDVSGEYAQLVRRVELESTGEIPPEMLARVLAA